MGITWNVAILCSETADVTKNCVLALLRPALCKRNFVHFNLGGCMLRERLLLRANTCNIEESSGT